MKRNLCTKSLLTLPVFSFKKRIERSLLKGCWCSVFFYCFLAPRKDKLFIHIETFFVVFASESKQQFYIFTKSSPILYMFYWHCVAAERKWMESKIDAPLNRKNPEQNWISIYVMLRRRKIHEFSLGEKFTLARACTSLNVPCTTANYWNIYLISSLCFMNKAVTVMFCSTLAPVSKGFYFYVLLENFEFCIRRQISEIIANHVNMPYTTAVKYLCVLRLFCISAAFLSCFKASKHSFK